MRFGNVNLCKHNLPFRSPFITFAVSMQKGLEHYIVKLLAQHDCAIIPGLGAFVVQHESAQLLPDCIIPPHATVGFNPLLTHTDGHLAALIMRSEGINNYRQAAAIIDQQVALWSDQLHQGQELQLDTLGTLRENQAGQLIFTPGNLDFLPANFALAPIYRKKAEQQPTSVTRLRPTYLRYAACVAFMLLCLLPQREANRYVDSATLDPTIWVRPSQVAQPDTIQVAEELTIEEVAEQLIQEPAQSVETAVAHKHHLIVASVDQTSAHTYCMQLQSEGHHGAHVIPYKNGYHRVAISSYATRTEAIQAMEELRTTESRFAKAWVFCE